MLRVRRLFEEHFGVTPSVITSAPGRVNLIGEHVDYSGGSVLPIGIALRTFVAMRPTSGSTSHVVSAVRGRGEFVHSSHTPSGQWWDYVHGPLRELGKEGIPVPAVNVAIVSDVPAGAGLSSSAALEVASVLAGVYCANEAFEDGGRIARMAYRAERDFVGVPCGIMDQTICAYAGFNSAEYIRCDTGFHEGVPFDRCVLIIDSATPRSLRTSDFAARERECAAALAALQRKRPSLAYLALATLRDVESAELEPTLLRRARHVVTEQERVMTCVRRLFSSESIGDLLLASHESLRSDFDCSTDELNWIVDWIAPRDGVDGARLTGAGWGGCAIAVGEAGALHEARASIASAFRARWGRDCRTWITTATDGLHSHALDDGEPVG